MAVVMLDSDERAQLAQLACEDIPPRYCRVVDIEIDGDRARVWLLMNDAPRFERYEVQFARQDDAWIPSLGSGGFQTGTPERVHAEAERLQRELDREARREA
jgi:hypothetical protein